MMKLWIYCWPEGFIPWLINLELFVPKLIKWLPGERADWFFDNIMTWKNTAFINDTACPGRKIALWLTSMRWTVNLSFKVQFWEDLFLLI